jgi:hypothetical protein
MTSFRIRPRFKVCSDKSPIEIQQRIEARLQSHPEDCTGMLIPNYFTLKIPYEQRHFWSPQLSLHLEEEEGQTVIRGLYGPHPNIWALFTFGYAAVGLLTLFMMMISLSKWSLGKSAMELWTLPFFILITIILYLSSQVGQKLGVEETFTIHHFLEKALEQKIHIS